MRSAAGKESLWQLLADLARRPWRRVRAAAYSDELAASQWWPAGTLLDLQRARLRRLVWHCFLNVPHWVEVLPRHLSPSAIERLDGAAHLPIGAAEARRAAPRRFVASTGERVGELRRTAGTRGAPQPVAVDVDALEQQRANRLRSEVWAGSPPGRVIAAWGRDAVREPRSLDATELDALEIALERAEGAVLSGPGPSLSALAATLAGRPSGVASVIARGADPQRGGARLAERLGARLHRFYGTTEFGVVAASCGHSESAALHVHAENFLVEIVDASGQPLPPGHTGRLLVTDLSNYATPYLRHETGDSGRLLDVACACGRALPLVEIG
jgi:phenylacetate-CoA ligase